MADCNNCEYRYACCSTDAWRIPITPNEALTITPRLKLANGQHVLASGADGMCFFFQDGACTCYNNRPETCKNFDCGGKADTMLKLMDTMDGAVENLDATHAGYLVAFVYATDKIKNAGELLITDPDNGKELRLIPNKIYGKSEEEVKNSMIEILKQPFKKEDI
jgi:Fe-S-cluster containining protein